MSSVLERCLFNFIGILEDLVCGAAELYCVAHRGVSNVYSTLMDINGLDKILEALLSILQCNSMVPQTAASKKTLCLVQSTLLLNGHTKLHIINFMKAVLQSCICFSWLYLINSQLSMCSCGGVTH